MIVRSIRVEGWRCFVTPVTVGPLSERLNVIYAPNGTGKSTLFEALRRALLDNHSVRARDVEDLRPWGRHLAPMVTVEFAHKGHEYRLTKRFLDGPMARLERREGGTMVPLCDGHKADEFVQDLFTRRPPERGLAGPQHWGIAQVLWAPQGQLQFARPSEDLVGKIRACLDVQAAGCEGGPLEARIEARYREFFAPKTGELKSGKNAPLRAQLEERLKELQARWAAARQTYQEFETVSRRVEEYRSRRTQARYTVDELARTLSEARARKQIYDSLQAERAEHQARLEAVEARYRMVQSTIETIEHTRRQLSETRASVQKLQEQLEQQSRMVDLHAQQARAAGEALEALRCRRCEVDEKIQRADDARSLREARTECDRLGRQLARIAETKQQLHDLRNRRAKLIAPDEKTIKAIRKAVQERDALQAQLDAAMITVEIDGQPCALQVLEGEQPGPRTLQAGKTLVVKGAPQVVVDVAGWVRLRARGPSGSVEDLRARHRRVVQKISELTRDTGTDNLERLETLYERARTLEQEIRTAQSLLETWLDGKTEEDLIAQRTRAERVVDEILARYPSWRTETPDEETLRNEADRARRTFEREEKELQAGYQKADSALKAAQNEETRLRTQLEATERHARTLQARLAELLADGRSDQERAQELDQLALDRHGAKTTLQSLEARLREIGDDPSSEVVRLERMLRDAEREASEALEREKIEEGRLQQLAAAAPHTTLVELEEEQARLKLELQREYLRTEAVKLLRTLLLQCRNEAVAAVSAPVERAATRILHRIAGERLGMVKVGEGFEPSHVTPELAQDTVDLTNVSGGEREQIYLATRLALAEVLARDERQMVVLDDVLTATDAGRLARVLSVLEEKSERLQIVVITCHPERYRSLAGAEFFDLERLMRAGSQAPAVQVGHVRE